MAKKRRPKAASSTRARARSADTPEVAVLRAALPEDVQVIPISTTSTVTVDVDVNEMTIPYTIALDTAVVIKAVVDRREDLPALTAGTHRLGWGFAHASKGWKHKVTLTVDGVATVLEERSEANKDTDHSIGLAMLVAS